jgi:translation initiation factor 1 (eIF-1/SUI1)
VTSDRTRKPDGTSEPEPTARKNPFEVLREKLGGSLPRGPEPAAPQTTPASKGGPKLVHERVTVRRERTGRGGKTVTLAEGPGLAGRDLETLARAAAKALGLGARVESGALVLQGDQAERLAAWLATRGFARVERGN